MPRTLEPAKALLKEYNISSAQMDVLRKASRKYANFGYPEKDGVRNLHTGEVEMYCVRQDTLDALKTAGYIQYGYRIHVENDRAAITTQVVELVTSAWTTVGTYSDPFSHQEFDGDKLQVWREVLGTLQVAKGKQDKLAEKCYLITESGREVASKFKVLIGAKEDE